MRLFIESGDVLLADADVLICPGNVQLNLSGGVSGEVLLRGGCSIQRELHHWLESTGKSYVERGTVVWTAPGGLPFRAILHTVAIDAFYATRIDQLACTIEGALRAAAEHGAESVAMPALATGYGRLTMAQFGDALKRAIANSDAGYPDRCRLVIRHEADAESLRAQLLAGA